MVLCVSVCERQRLCVFACVVACLLVLSTSVYFGSPKKNFWFRLLIWRIKFATETEQLQCVFSFIFSLRYKCFKDRSAEQNLRFLAKPWTVMRKFRHTHSTLCAIIINPNFLAWSVAVSLPLWWLWQSQSSEFACQSPWRRASEWPTNTEVTSKNPTWQSTLVTWGVRQGLRMMMPTVVSSTTTTTLHHRIVTKSLPVNKQHLFSFSVRWLWCGLINRQEFVYELLPEVLWFSDFRCVVSKKKMFKFQANNLFSSNISYQWRKPY